MSELATRILSGVALAAVVLGLLWLGSWWYLGLLLVGGALVLYEFERLVGAMRLPTWRRTIWTISGVGYVAFAVHGFWVTRMTFPHGFFFSVWLFLTVWATDIGAYAFGRLVGGPKIAPTISPSKTWAGLVGAIVCVAVVANIMFAWPVGELSYGMKGVMTVGLLWGAPLAVLAQFGDFFESAMKRRAGVKDSGTLIPGHGGVFDRVDGLLPVAIVFPVWIEAIAR